MSDTPADPGFVHRFEPGREPDRAPLLLLHGTGGDEHDLIPLVERLAPDAAILSPRGKVNEQGLTRFFRRSPNGVWDRDDFEARTLELAGFVRQACAAYRLPRPIALGYSNGANIAWNLLLKAPDLLAGAVLLRAMLPFVPVLLIAGTDDELIPVERAGLLAALLGEAGADVSYEALHAGHGLTAQDLALVGEWLAARR
jgi:phospholipase/carboxylesterase